MAHRSADPSSPLERGATESTSLTLLQRARAREPEAWQRLVGIYASLVYRWCRQGGLSPEDARDVGQEVFLAVDLNLDRFRRDRPGDRFRGWLWTITQNKVRDHFRRQGHAVQAKGGTSAQQWIAEIPESLPLSTSQDVWAADDAVVLRGVLETLQDRFAKKNWDAFWRTTVKGESGKDVAGDLGMSVPAVYQAKYRILQRIRQELNDLIG